MENNELHNDDLCMGLYRDSDAIVSKTLLRYCELRNSRFDWFDNVPQELATQAHYDFNVALSLDATGRVNGARETIFDRRSDFRSDLQSLLVDLSQEKTLRPATIREYETQIEAEFADTAKLRNDLPVKDSSSNVELTKFEQSVRDSAVEFEAFGNASHSPDFDATNEEGSFDFDAFLAEVDGLDATKYNPKELQASNASLLDSFDLELARGAPPKTTKFAVNVDLTKPIDAAEMAKCTARSWNFELDPFQKYAVMLIEAHQNVLVAAHTAAGKTVVAEYAIAQSLQRLGRCVYTSPIKALSNQKYRDLKEVFDDVGLITGDVQIEPNASCLVVTTEILRTMLYKRSSLIDDLEWVIFDEVHYMNDVERGVVWEETLILLPPRVGLVLLSATLPNCLQLAEWVGRIKQRTIHVVTTLRRPVPLEHYLFTGHSPKVNDELFKIVDANRTFIEINYRKAIEAKQQSVAKKNAITRPGVKGNNALTPQQDQQLWLGVISMLKKHDKLPTIAFVFSRNRIEEIAQRLSSVDLVDNSEKSGIQAFFNRSISRLRSEDRENLPQIANLRDLLSRGIGIHHSGILPLLKEVVEILFTSGKVKLLFATETFAMGVNAPARTVIFDSVKKHDGERLREIYPGEYTQMAGRAGRRGHDKIGTSIILCKGDADAVPDLVVLKTLILGSAVTLISKFRLTYAMILRHARLGSGLTHGGKSSVIDMMRSSFAELELAQSEDDRKAQLHKLHERANEIGQTADEALRKCSDCKDDLEQFFNDCATYERCSTQLYEGTLKDSAVAPKVFCIGRVISLRCIVNGAVAYTFGVVLKCEAASNVGGGFVFNFLTFSNNSSEVTAGVGQFLSSKADCYPYVPHQRKCFLLTDLSKMNDADVQKSCVLLEKIEVRAIDRVWNRVIKLEGSKCIEAISRWKSERSVAAIASSGGYRKKDDLDDMVDNRKDSATQALIKQLKSVAAELQSLVALQVPAYLEIADEVSASRRDIYSDLHEKAVMFRSIASTIAESVGEGGDSSRMKLRRCLGCQRFAEHFDKLQQRRSVESQLRNISWLLSDENLRLMPEYNERRSVLLQLGYLVPVSADASVDNSNTLSDVFVTRKGLVAAEADTAHDVLIAEMLFANVLHALDVPECAALLSALVYQETSKKRQKEEEPPEAFGSAAFQKAVDTVNSLASMIDQVQDRTATQNRHEGNRWSDFAKASDQVDFGLACTISEWCKGLSFAQVIRRSPVQEGTLVRYIHRLNELINQLKVCALSIGDVNTYQKLSEASIAIRRDIVFAASLYVQ